MMNGYYRIKCYFLLDSAMDCRFDMILPSFADVCEFFRCVNLSETYDVVKVYPEEVKEI